MFKEHSRELYRLGEAHERFSLQVPNFLAWMIESWHVFTRNNTTPYWAFELLSILLLRQKCIG
jgi:hypothetical protein